MNKKQTWWMVLFIFTLMISPLCKRTSDALDPVDHIKNELKVEIVNKKGKKIGSAIFSQHEHEVDIHIQAAKLPPGLHGVHIHEKGSCKSPKFKSAGAHFNPYKKQHGFHNQKGYHAGDLPNIKVNPDGTVNTHLISADVTLLKGKLNSLLSGKGTTLIIHENEDDYKTDPSGNSGDRIACGVIR